MSSSELKYKNLCALPVALITDNGMPFFQSTTDLPEGIKSGCNIALVRLTNPLRPWRIHGGLELEDIIRTRPRLRSLLYARNKNYDAP